MKLPRAHHLTAEELAGQVLIPRISFPFLNREAPAARKLVQFIQKFHIGGFLLDSTHPAEIRFWTDFLQRQSRFPLLFAAQVWSETGDTLWPGTPFPSLLHWHATGDADLVAQGAQCIGLEARSMGLNLLLLPVLSASYRQNAEREWWETSREAFAETALLAERMIARVQQLGIACVIGDILKTGPSSETQNENKFASKQIPPDGVENRHTFLQRLVQTGTKGFYLKWSDSADTRKLRELASILVNGELRNIRGFRGIVFGEMPTGQALAGETSFSEQLIQPFEFGLDALIIEKQLPLAHRILTEKILSDASFRKKVEAAVERIFSLKKWLHNNEPAQKHPYRVFKVIGHSNHVGVARKIAERGLTLVYHSDRYPFWNPFQTTVMHLIFSDSPSPQADLSVFQKSLAEFFDEINSRVNPTTSEISSHPDGLPDFCLISFHLREPASRQKSRIRKRLAEIVAYCQESSVPVVLLVFGFSLKEKFLHEIPLPDALLLAYDDSPAVQSVALKAVVNLIPVQGKSPLPLPENFQTGISVPPRYWELQENQDIRIQERVEELINRHLPLELIETAGFLLVQNGVIQAYRIFPGPGISMRQPGKAGEAFSLNAFVRGLLLLPSFCILQEDNPVNLYRNLKEFFGKELPSAVQTLTLQDLFLGKLSRQQRDSLHSMFNLQETVEGQFFPDAMLCNILLIDILERVSGNCFGDFFLNKICQPLGLKDGQWISFSVVSRNENSSGEEFPGYQFTASLKDAAVLAQLLVQGGFYRDKRLFKNRTLEDILKELQGGMVHKSSKRSAEQCSFSPEKIFLNHGNGSFLLIDRLNQKILLWLIQPKADISNFWAMISVSEKLLDAFA